MVKLNQKDFAALPEVAVSKARISAAIKSGVLSESVTKKAGKGRGGNDIYEIDKAKGIEEWRNNRDISRMPDPEKADAARDLAGELKSGDGKSNYQKAKTMAAFYDAQIKKLEYGEMAGDLVRADQVKAAAFRAARNVRDAILNLPGRVSQEIATMSDAHAIEMYLMDQLSETLEGLGDAGGS